MSKSARKKVYEKQDVKKRRKKVDIWHPENEVPIEKQTAIHFRCSYNTRRAWAQWMAVNNDDGEIALKALLRFRGLEVKER